ncbi:MAG: HYR domain-containing protein [Bacteroidota bacterium]
MRKGLLALFSAFAVLEATAQNTQWVYDFGTASAAPYTSTTYSTGYLPAAQNGGGNAGVRASSATEGPVELITTGLAGGSGAELKMTGGSTTTGAKFGLATYSGTVVGTFQCRINVGAGTNGRFIIYFGNGANFTSGSGISVPQTFASLRFSPGSTAVGLDWLSSATAPNYTTTGLSQTTINKNQAYTLKFFMNNSNNAASYITGSGVTLTTHSLPAGTFDIWIDNVKLLTNADPGTGLLPQGTIINGMNLLNVGAGSSAPVMYIDDISYTNFLTATPPVAVTNTILNINYENGTANSGIAGINPTDAPAVDAAYMIAPGATGNHGVAHKVTLGNPVYYSDGAYRSESDAVSVPQYRYLPGDERRYEFSVLLKDWEQWNSANPAYGDNIFQLKMSDEQLLPVRILTRRNSIVTRNYTEQNDLVTDFRPYINQWIHFRIDVKWTTDNTGYLKIYTKLPDQPGYNLMLDRDNFVTFTGNVANGNVGYVKWGVYREAGTDANGNVITSDNALTRIAHHDDIRIFELNNASAPVQIWGNTLNGNVDFTSPVTIGNTTHPNIATDGSTTPDFFYGASGSGLNSAGVISGRVLLNGWTNKIAATDPATPFNPNQYFEFRLQPASGYKIDFSNLRFTARKGNTADPATFVIRSSIDGFASDITAPQTFSGTAATLLTYDLSPLSNVKTPITLRLYWYGSNRTGGIPLVGIDDFTFNGQVKAVLHIPSTTDITRNTNTGLCTYAAQSGELDVAALNSCSTVSYGYSLTGATVATGTGSLANKVFNKGVTTVTLTATDECNNATSSFTVTVTDNELPSITAPASISTINDAGQCGATVVLGTPATSDNCGVASVSNDAPAIFPIGATTVTWIVTDTHGNSKTATQIITVTDTEKPIITAPAAIVASNDAGQCGAALTLTNPVVSDNCGIASITNNAPTVFPAGTTIVSWTAEDVNGNTETATQSVTVVDGEVPALTPTTFVSLCHKTSGNYFIPAATATENCSISTIAFAISGATSRSGNGLDASGNFNIGESVVRWTITDNAGNSSTTTTTVTINRKLSASIADVYAVNPGGNTNTIYLGYGPTSLTLNATPEGGTAPYTFSWSNGATSEDIAVSPSTPVVNSYTATITDAKGCFITVTKPITVTDIRCAAGKVKICHVTSSNHDNDLCISETSVAAHLAHGCYLGACQSMGTIGDGGTTTIARQKTNGFTATVAPNPTKSEFRISVTGDNEQPVVVRLFDVAGRVIKVIKADVGQTVFLGRELMPGAYLAEITNGRNKKVLKLIKQ